MYKLFINIHIIFSSLFFLLAFFVIGNSLLRLHQKKSFRYVDGWIGKGYLVFLYLQLVSGIILYFFLKPSTEQQIKTLEQAIANSKLRFWAIEHLALMIFALTLAQIGYIFIKKAGTNQGKHRNTLFYYGISLVVVSISTGLALIREGIF